MGSWENKTLADKLNSLQGFPDGYMPDLSSKWEIIEAGLPEGKKRRATSLIIRWSVAAAILLAAFFLWVNDTQTPKNEPLVSTQSINKAPILNNHQPVAVVKDKDDSKEPLVKEITASSTVKKDNLTEATSLQQKAIAKLDVQPTFIVSDTVTKLDTITTLPQIGLASVMPTEKVKASRKRVYQRDFNDGILVMDTGFSPLPRQHFSIQLNPFTRKTNDEEPPTRLLQLKQVL